MKQWINPSAFVLLLANLVPLIGVLVWDWSVINVLLIFGSERRGGHDQIAGTKVVMYHPDRPHLT